MNNKIVSEKIIKNTQCNKLEILRVVKWISSLRYWWYYLNTRWECLLLVGFIFLWLKFNSPMIAVFFPDLFIKQQISMNVWNLYFPLAKLLFPNVRLQSCQSIIYFSKIWVFNHRMPVLLKLILFLICPWLPNTTLPLVRLILPSATSNLKLSFWAWYTK